MSKSLVFCFDGTSNDPSDAVQESHLGGSLDDSNITNVLKLHLLFGGDLVGGAAVDGQRSFYYSGVGTFGSKIRRIVNSAFSPEWRDVAHILRSGIADLKEHYEPGDRLYAFGFSRGAALARRFAAIAREKSGIPDLQFRFLGVFDTVASIGKPNLDSDDRPASDVVFENGHVAPSVLEALHLVALDERRKAFRPTLMNAEDRVTEVWFPGVHSDVGGGYRQDGLSDVALQYMLEQIAARDVGLRTLAEHEVHFGSLEPQDADYRIDFEDLAIQPNHHGVLHRQQRLPLTSKVTLAVRDLRVNVDDQPSAAHVPLVHRSAADRVHEDPSYRPDALGNRRHRIAWPDGQEIDYQGLQEHTWARPLRHLAVDETLTVPCFANLLHNRTNLVVRRGEAYGFRVDGNQRWKDGAITCSAAGWTRESERLGWREMFIWMAEDNRRKPDSAWFALLGSVGEDDGTAFEVLRYTTNGDERYQPPVDGELFLFANDVADRYANNAGVMQVEIRRLA